MAIAHDSEILGAANAVAGAYVTAITPTNPPNGVCVVIEQNGVTSDLITSVTYGSVLLTRRRFNTEATEAGGIYIYWGAGTLPTGTQNVTVNRTSTSSMRAAISTMTVAAGMQVAVDSDATGNNASIANPSWTHSSVNNNVVAYLGIHSGLTTMTNTPATNWTLAPTPGFEDMGAQGRGWARRTLATAGALAPGWTAATADDFVGASIAFYEAPMPSQQGGVTRPQATRIATFRAANW